MVGPLAELIRRWRERARMNAMPPSDASRDIADPARWAWKNVGIAQQQCADELDAALTVGAERPKDETMELRKASESVGWINSEGPLNTAPELGAGGCPPLRRRK